MRYKKLKTNIILFIFALFAIVILEACDNKASNPEALPSNSETLGFLFRGFNVLSGNEILSENLSTSMIIKPGSGNVLANYYTINLGTNSKVVTYEGNSIIESAIASGLDMSVSLDAEVGVSKLFKASAGEKYGKVINKNVENSTEVYFYHFSIQHIEGTVFINNIGNSDTTGGWTSVSKSIKNAIKKQLDSEFLNALKKADDIEKDIFQKYGTHFLAQYTMGGYSDVITNTTATKNSTSGSLSEISEIELKASGTIGAVDLGLTTAYKNAINTVMDYNNDVYITKTISYSRGGHGGISVSNDPDKISEIYNTWIESFKENGTYEIITNDNLRLVPIWELLPDGNDKRKEELRLKYIELSTKQDVEFIKSFGGSDILAEVYPYDEMPEYNSEVTYIHTAKEFADIGQNSGDEIDGIYILMNDIYLSELDSQKEPFIHSKTFVGIFDGNNKTIRFNEPSNGDTDYSKDINPDECYNLGKKNKSQNDKGSIGLFMHNTGIIKNLNVENMTIDCYTSNIRVGIITGWNNGTIKNCHVQNSYIKVIYKNSISFTGGVAGSNLGIISNCSYSGEIDTYSSYGKNTDKANTILAGGITGMNSGEILDCYSDADISNDVCAFDYNDSKEVISSGGIAGKNVKDIKRCFSIKAVETLIHNEKEVDDWWYDFWNKLNVTDKKIKYNFELGRSGSITGNNQGLLEDCFCTDEQVSGSEIEDGVTSVRDYGLEAVTNVLTKDYGWYYNNGDNHPMLSESKNDTAAFFVKYEKTDFHKNDILSPDNITIYFSPESEYIEPEDVTSSVQLIYDFSETGNCEVQMIYQKDSDFYLGVTHIEIK